MYLVVFNFESFVVVVVLSLRSGNATSLSTHIVWPIESTQSHASQINKSKEMFRTNSGQNHRQIDNWIEACTPELLKKDKISYTEKYY